MVSYTRVATLTICFIGGLLLGCILRYPSQTEQYISLPPAHRNAPLTLTYPRVVPRPECTTEMMQKDPKLCSFLKDYQMTERDRQSALDVLEFFNTLARKKGWTFFMAYGTLLGSWRHHGFIPYDYDIDLCVDINHKDELVRAIESQDDYKLVPDPRGFFHLYSDTKATMNVFTAMGKFKSPFVDLFFYKDTGKHLQSISYKNKLRPKSEMFPLHERPFETFSLPAPRDSLMFLLKEYGPSDQCQAFGGPEYKCEELKKTFGFVHREFKSGAMVETLRGGPDGKVIHVKNIKEDKASITKTPYTLEAVGKPIAESAIYPPDPLDMAMILAREIQ